ncbi:MAG TPA: pectin acetylesterase-family hydrolase [Candidatus Dormibacteraeota bacterium]|nr:pectin acetylesterase-family hydrolase [Candidatus Dormibacteraeota bacterium]
MTSFSFVGASRALVIGAALAGGLFVTVPAAHAAAAYPTNTCVGAKLKGAGKFCGALLKAWSTWDKKQDAAQRDAAIAKAQGKLDDAWGKAEAKSAGDGVDCAQTTLSSADLGVLVGTVAAQIAAAVNTGFDLGNKDDGKCGASLIKLAAKKCQALLLAEGKFVAKLDKDPSGTKRAEALSKATGKFSDGWAKVLAQGCAPTATEGATETSVDSLRDDVVMNATVSPNVDDTQYTAVAPVGPIDYQGRAFTPVCMNGSPYQFFVKRGTVNKLLMYYQGGGACWEQLTCGVPVCDNSVTAGDNPNGATTGFFDRNNPNNPFKDWNVVFVSYCSCDIHFGDSAQVYDNVDPMSPVHVEHRGYQNSKVAEKWAREHFVNPEEVFVTGSSAGAYGAWFNGPLLESVWPASKFSVLADAGNGVITTDFLTNSFPHWNFAANLPSDIPGLSDVLTNGSGIPGYTEIVANRFPNTTWAHYSTAYDGGTGGQTGFYNVMLNNNDPLAALTWWNGSCQFNSVMRQQVMDTSAAVPSNYRYYIGTGSRHTMFGSNKVYTDTTGGVPTVVNWVDAMLNSSPPMLVDPAWTNVECTNCGLLLAGDPRPSPLAPPFQQVGTDVVVTCP